MDIWRKTEREVYSISIEVGELTITTQRKKTNKVEQ